MAVPAPRMIAGLKYVCYCGERFWSMHGYAWHYQTFH
jgi:hypothetical protein